MNFDRTNQWLTLIANIGVLAGVIFLAYELQQNRVAVESQIRAEIALSSSEDQWNWISFPELTETWLKFESCESVSEIESTMLARAVSAEFKRWENIHYQFRLGLYSETEFQGQRNAWSGAMRNSRFYSDWWPRNKMRFSLEFSEFIDELHIPTESNEACQ